MKFNQNYQVAKTAIIGKNVKIGDGTIIYDHVEIGDNAIIANDCVIGEPLNSYYRNSTYKQPQTIIGSYSLVRSHTIIYGGVKTGANFSTGHRTTIRENSSFGKNCSIGTLSDVQEEVEFGDYCRLHSNVFIGEKTTL